MNIEFYKSRRRRLAQLIPNCTLVLPAWPEYIRNADSPLMSRVAIEYRANQKAWDLFHTTTVNKLPPQMLTQFEVPEAKKWARGGLPQVVQLSGAERGADGTADEPQAFQRRDVCVQRLGLVGRHQ